MPKTKKTKNKTRSKKEIIESTNLNEISLAEAIELIEDREETKRFMPAEKTFWRRLSELPENAYEEKGAIYYYLLRTVLKGARLFEGEKLRGLYDKMEAAFRAQNKFYKQKLVERRKDKLVRLQYHAFLKLAERYFFSLEVIYHKKDWDQAYSRAHAEKMNYRQKLTLFERRYFEWIFYKFLQISSKYGDSFWRWGLTTLVTIFVFGMLFWGIDTVETGGDLVTKHGGGVDDYFYFSIVTFTTLGYGDFTPITDLQKIIVGFEAVSGYLMLGSFIALLQRKIK